MQYRYVLPGSSSTRYGHGRATFGNLLGSIVYVLLYGLGYILNFFELMFFVLVNFVG